MRTNNESRSGSPLPYKGRGRGVVPCFQPPPDLPLHKEEEWPRKPGSASEVEPGWCLIAPVLKSGMRVLVIEDDDTIASFITKGLEQSGMAVDSASNGEEGLQLALSFPYDAAIVDIMLPKLDGLTLVQRMREKKMSTPVIILSAKRSVDDRVRGLQSGGDDYLVKPFAFSELLARVQALIRRSGSTTQETYQLSVDDLSMNLLTREVLRGEQFLDLQPREFALLEYLMRSAGRVVSKTMILEHVWNYSFDPQTNVVDVLVCRLRIKVDKDFPVKLIHTIRGVGYVLKKH